MPMMSYGGSENVRVTGQPSYQFKFQLKGLTDTMLYVGRHYRDEVQLMDSTRLEKGKYCFAGRRTWERGVYAIVRQDRKTVVGDFAIDDSQKFSIEGDDAMTPATVRVAGSEVNREMFDYLATLQAAQKEAREIREKRKNTETQAEAEQEEAALTARMLEYQGRTLLSGKRNVFFELVRDCDNPDVPEEEEDKARYFRVHYWDRLFEPTEQGTRRAGGDAYLYSPQLFNKMNYYFFGLLYHADADTICMEIDKLMERIDGDTAMQRYVLQYIEPRYFRSTKNIGWDAVWCHIAKEYYLKGKCAWARESELYLMQQNYKRISQSIIGAHGQELWMADTNQSQDPKEWVSSHRFRTPYVILWFWDPDCHHCQEQSEELKKLYDDMVARGEKRFEVYAVGYESDVEKWKRYVREHDFKWVNVGGPNVNIDYQEAYNVHGAPTMIILNRKRDIIMNKVIAIKNLMGFLDDYEKKGNK